MPIFLDMGQQGTLTGESIRTLRRLAEMSLEDVAGAAETSVAYLSKVERGVFVPTKAYVARVTTAIADRLRSAA
jgi:transcriptional regulator with XRE-family HTH domain